MLRGQPGRLARINRGSLQARNLPYFTDFREGGGSSVANLMGDLEVGSTVNMESSDWGEDDFGTFLDFDGINEHVAALADTDTIISSTTAPFTVCVWARAAGYPAVRDAMVSARNSSGNQGFDLRLENSGGSPANGLVFSVGSFSAEAAYFPAADFTVTDLNHYVGRYDGTNLDIFVNGQKGVSDTSAGADLWGQTMYFGVNFNDAFSDRNFGGKLYDVRFEGRALSEGEIQHRFHFDTRFDIYDDSNIIPFLAPPAPASGRIMSSLAASGGLAGKGGIAGQGGGLAA